MYPITSYEQLMEFTDSSLSIVLLSTKLCQVCVAISPKLEMMLKKYPHVKLGKVQIDEEPEIRGQLLVFSVPTVILFQNKKEVFRQSRFIELTQIEKYIHLLTNNE